MPVHIYLGRDLQNHVHEFQYRHEVEGFRRICSYLWEKFHHQDRTYAAVANLRRTGTGREVTPDMVLISELGLGVLEFKHTYGVIDCGNPEGAWQAGPLRVQPYRDVPEDSEEEGIGYLNPHKQIQDYASRIRWDLIRKGSVKWLPGGLETEKRLKIHTAVCFTNPEAILAGCKEAVRVHYRPGDALKDWEIFSVITPAEAPEWALELRYEVDQGPAQWYRPMELNASEVLRLATSFFGGAPWREMDEQMHASRPPFAYLALIEEGKQVQIYRLDHDEVLVGRSPDICNVTISSRYGDVSRKHARVLHTIRGVYIEDAGSKYGTYLDGEQVSKRAELKGPGQVLTLGGPVPGKSVCQLQYLAEAPLPQATGMEN